MGYKVIRCYDENNRLETYCPHCYRPVDDGTQSNWCMVCGGYLDWKINPEVNYD